MTLINISDKSEFAVLVLGLIEENKLVSKRLTYAGIGSRNAPITIIRRSSQIAKRLEHQWFVLYTGGAYGMDTAFMAGTQFYKCFMPSSYHNGRISNRLDLIDCSSLTNWHEANKFVIKYHPNVPALKPYSKTLMARNSYCILGQDLNSPVDFVLCWTPNGEDVGGTAQGIRIARDWNIPIFNLANDNVLADVLRVLKLNLFD